MSKLFQLYAAPRATDGRYRFCGEQHIYIKTFATLEAMLCFWETAVLPKTCTTRGLRYELSMVELGESEWDFIGDPRYVDTSVLEGKKIFGSFVVNC